MNNSKLLKLKVIMLCVIVLTFFSGMTQYLNGQPTETKPLGISYPLALPSISNTSPTGITGYGATLNGSVNANNESTTVTFEYSTDGNFPDEETPDPTSVPADQSPVTGTSYTAVSATLTGLTPGTTYYYRIVAVNASGTKNGDLQIFSTSPLAAVTTGIASPVTTTTATLNGTVDANDNSTTVTFEYGTTEGYGTTVTADQSPVTGTTATAVSKAISGLTPNTTYHFRVVGVNTLGTSYGEDNTFFTAAPAAPTATTNDATFSITANTATLNGTVNANNANTTVTFQYGTTTAYGYSASASQNPVLGSADTAVSAYITGLFAGTTYHFRVVAVNSAGTTYGADNTFLNTTAPYAKTTEATLITETTARMNGIVNPKAIEGAPNTTVTFEYGLTTSYGDSITASQSPIDGSVNQSVTADLSGLSPNTTYHYRVIANNTNGTGTGEDMAFTTSSLPVVTTNAASPVGNTSATLNGIVNANNNSTTVTFQYGLTTAYGTTVTADQSPVTGNTNTAVSRAITGLTNATTYHFRVVAENSSGTVYGEDRTFITGIAPPTVTTNAATGVATTTATINGTVNANGFSTAVSFEWGTTTNYNRTSQAVPSTVTGSSNTAVSASLVALTPNTTYHFRVVGQNAGGTVYGVDRTFTTSAAPGVTTNVASSVSTTGATLNGTVNAYSQSTTVTFEYGTTTAYGTSVTADQSPVTGSTDTAVSKAITGLTPGITYHYRVRGTNASGTSYGADTSFITAVGAPIVTTGAASPLTLGAVVQGVVNAQNSSTTVTVEYGTTVAYGSTVTADQSPVTGSIDTDISATISGLSFNTTYHYRVVGTNANGTTYGNDLTFKTTLSPSGITGEATDVTGTAAILHGTANGNGGTWSVRFDYGTTVAYGSSMTATPDTTSGSTDTPVTATLNNLLPSTTYHYRISVYSGGMNYYGSDMTFTTLSGPAITTDAATAVGAQTATLNGTANANNMSTTVSFEYGSTTNYDRAITAAQSPVTGSTNTSVSADLISLIPDSTYHYRAVASNANGTVYGADMTFQTSALPPSVATSPASAIDPNNATLNGIVNPNNDSTTVTFEYGTTIAYGTTVTADQSPVTGSSDTVVSKAITGLSANTTYHYRVVGQNGNGTTNGLDVTFTTGTNLPSATTNAATAVSNSEATLNGTINANNNSTTVTFEYGPTIAYGKTVTADQSPVSGTSDTPASVTISGLIGASIYHYRVVAQNAFGTVYGSDMTLLTAGLAPIVYTDAAGSITATTAIINGTVNAQNGETTVTFEYGTTTAYGTTVTADQSPVNGNTDTPVTNTISGLSPNTTYHYRVIGQSAYGTTTGADITFTTALITFPTVITLPVQNVTTSSATSGGNVTDEGMGNVTAKGVCWNTSQYPTIANSTTNDGSGLGAFTSTLTGLTENTTYYVRAYATNSAGTAYGGQYTFTTNSGTITVEITNPDNGEQVSGTVSIEATASDSAQAISKLEFYINDSLIGTDTTAPYSMNWDTTAVSDGSYVIKVMAYNAANKSSQATITVFVVNNGGSGELQLNRTKLIYGAVPINGNGSFDKTYDQTILIDSINGNSFSWSVNNETSWLYVSPTSGNGPGVISVGVNPAGLSAGTYNGSLQVVNTSLAGDSVTVSITLTVYNTNATAGPFGTFSTPVNNSTVMSSIPVTGWVLDDIATTSVKIYRNSNGSGMTYIGDANFVDGARPDVQTAYPGYPLNYQAGWGYMLLTNALPKDGKYTLYAIATDMEGNETTLGSKTITVNNADAVLPFGALDTPAQGGNANGSAFVNFAWALTPKPNTIPTDGSTLKVWIDGLPLPGNPDYNLFRQDIADLFPGYNNSNGAGGHMTFDTTKYKNGVHTIAWSVKDDAGNSDGIGSRFFSIINTGYRSNSTSTPAFSTIQQADRQMAVQYIGDLAVHTGFDPYSYQNNVMSNEMNITQLVIKELEPVQVSPNSTVISAAGYMLVDGQLAHLPIGSTFNSETGMFSWLPGPGFVNTYHFIFFYKNETGQINKMPLDILIQPKFTDNKPLDLENQPSNSRY